MEGRDGSMVRMQVTAHISKASAQHAGSMWSMAPACGQQVPTWIWVQPPLVMLMPSTNAAAARATRFQLEPGLQL